MGRGGLERRKAGQWCVMELVTTVGKWGSIRRGGPAEEQHGGHLRTVHRASEKRAYICGSRVAPVGLSSSHFQATVLESRHKPGQKARPVGSS